MKHVPIPAHWTGEEALSMAGFLESIIRAIRRAHGDEMSEVMMRDHCPPPDPEPDFPLDEELPF